MKCNQSRPGFPLVSPRPFPTTITITPRAPPIDGTLTSAKTMGPSGPENNNSKWMYKTPQITSSKPPNQIRFRDTPRTRDMNDFLSVWCDSRIEGWKKWYKREKNWDVVSQNRDKFLGILFESSGELDQGYFSAEVSPNVYLHHLGLLLFYVLIACNIRYFNREFKKCLPWVNVM